MKKQYIKPHINTIVVVEAQSVLLSTSRIQIATDHDYDDDNLNGFIDDEGNIFGD